MQASQHPRMQIIVINSQKAGSGKTRLCAHLADEAQRAGDGPVYVIDTDPQGPQHMAREPRRRDAASVCRGKPGHAQRQHHRPGNRHPVACGPSPRQSLARASHYAAAMTDGHTAPELASRGPYALELAALWANIKPCLRASMPVAKVKAHA
jgi:hypothetical protein